MTTAPTRPRPFPAGTGVDWPTVAGILVLALNLRAALAAYPPLLPAVRTDLGLSAGVAGLPQTAAVLAMAAGSFAGSAATARADAGPTLGLAVAAVGAGSVLRGWPVTAALFAGTALIGLGTGVAGVAMAAVVRDRFPGRAGVLSGGYVVAMMVGATAAGAFTVPLAGRLGGWSAALAVWSLPALAAAAAWTVLTRPGSDRAGHHRPAHHGPGHHRPTHQRPAHQRAAHHRHTTGPDTG